MSTPAPLMLGVSGCRGIVGASLTPDVAARYAGAFAAVLREIFGSGPIRVALARDGRAGCEFLHHAALSGLLAAGLEVVDLGVVMTPTAGIAVDRAGAAAGMILTASHNPQQWNGLKCLVRAAGIAPGLVDACAPDAALADRIIAKFKGGQPLLVPWDKLGNRSLNEEATPAHVDLVVDALEQLDLVQAIEEAAFSVVVDSVNGSGAEGALLLLERLGCSEILHLGGESTGLFPHTPEPTRENLGELCLAVREAEGHVGFAQDPDADRLAIIDERGEYIGEEYTLALAAEAVLSAGGFASPVLATNLSTSRMLEDVAAGHKGRVVRTAVGEANVTDAMKREKCVLGGEGNGGVIWPRVTFVRDSLSAMGLTLGLMAARKKKLSELVSAIPSYAIVKRKVDLASKDAAKPGLERLASHFAKERVDRQDGVRVDIDSKRAWLHVRASNTEPILRLIAEAPTAGEANVLLDEAAKVIGA